MPQLIFFEDAGYRQLLPLTYWRTAGELRCGRRRLIDHARAWFGATDTALWVRPELRDVVARRTGAVVNAPARPGSILACARWLAEGSIDHLRPPAVGVLGDEIAFIFCDQALAGRLDPRDPLDTARLSAALEGVPRLPALGRMITWPWELLDLGARMLEIEWRTQEAGCAGEVDGRAHLIDPHHIHVAAGAIVQAGAVLDATEGPVYIDAGARIRPNAVVDGPTYVGSGAQVNPGAWVRGRTVIGPQCRIGGELAVCVLQGRANKQHHGFLGHSLVGEWVNLGAGTTTSNLKNTYGTVRVPIAGVPVDSGCVFMGAILGDFARTGINQSLATGAVIGLASSVAGTAGAPRFVPSFRFLTGERDEPYDPPRALEVARRMMARRGVEMTPEEEACFLQLPEIAAQHETV